MKLTAPTAALPYRRRRSCLAVPGNQPRFQVSALSVDADEVFLDLEDAVPAAAKAAARATVINALTIHRYPGKTKTVRVNATDTRWCYGDVVALVEACGDELDCIMLPKVQGHEDVHFLDQLLNQLEAAIERERRVGLELQIETARGLENVGAIARASSRTEALIFGPVDFAASMYFPTLHQSTQHPEYDVDFWHYFLARMAVAGRSQGLQVIDGPYGAVGDIDGLERVARRVASLGFDGKWAIHPKQVACLNEVFSPSAQELTSAVHVLQAYAESEKGGRGAVVLDGAMIDEASLRMARATLERAHRLGIDAPC